MMLYFRADINETIASGHIMRCLAIADAAKQNGDDSCFILADENGVQLIQERGHKSIVLNTKWNDMDAELEVLLPLVEAEGINSILVDSYYATYSYLEALKSKCKVIYFDDLDDKVYPVDAIINYDGIGDKDKYLEKYKAIGTHAFWGYQYIPLRKEFFNIQNEGISNRINKVLITSGGADSKHAIRKILSGLELNSYEMVTAICGKLNKDYGLLKSEYSNYKNVNLLQAVNDIHNYMCDADICISAAGNTVYEIAACGTPAIVYTVSNEQVKAAETLNNNGMVMYAGSISDKDIIGRINSLLRDLYEDKCAREAYAKRAKNVVDGRGAVRIYEIIKELSR